jgi:transposase-like protein
MNYGQTRMFPSQDELHDVLFNSTTAKSYLVKRGVIQPERTCGICNVRASLCLAKEKYMHNCHGRTRRISMWTGTFFVKSKLEPCLILRLAHFWLAGCTHTQMSMLTNCARQTITDFLSFFNQLVSEHLDETFQCIGGKDVIVEIDEMKIAKHKHNRGHHVEGAWCIVGVERTQERRLFIVEVDNRDEETIWQVIKEYVVDGSIIYTDCWRAYSFLNREGLFEHHTVNHSLHFKDPDTLVHTNTVEGTNSAIKARIPKQYRTRCALTLHLHVFIWSSQPKMYVGSSN